jgi:predicted ATPase
VLWTLGYPDKAHEQEQRFVDLLRVPLDPQAYGLGVYHAVIFHCDFLRDDQIARADAEDTLARSIRASVKLTTAIGLVSVGRVAVAQGDSDAGIVKITEGMCAFDNPANYDLFSYMAAAAFLQAHHLTEGLALTEKAIAKAEAGGIRLFEADLHRLKGEFLLTAGQPKNEAESAFRDAITIARQHQAKSFELRATMSLARLLAQQGRKAEARTMLGDIYGWFTEGFDTADLKDAKALLGELSN